MHQFGGRPRCCSLLPLARGLVVDRPGAGGSHPQRRHIRCSAATRRCYAGGTRCDVRSQRVLDRRLVPAEVPDRTEIRRCQPSLGCAFPMRRAVFRIQFRTALPIRSVSEPPAGVRHQSRSRRTILRSMWPARLRTVTALDGSCKIFGVRAVFLRIRSIDVGKASDALQSTSSSPLDSACSGTITASRTANRLQVLGPLARGPAGRVGVVHSARAAHETLGPSRVLSKDLPAWCGVH